VKDRRQDYPRGPLTKKFSLFFSIIIAAIFWPITNRTGFSRVYRIGQGNLLTLGFWKPSFSCAISELRIREEIRFSDKTASGSSHRFYHPGDRTIFFRASQSQGRWGIRLVHALVFASFNAEWAGFG